LDEFQVIIYLLIILFVCLVIYLFARLGFTVV